jgi:hypothetical protein
VAACWCSPGSASCTSRKALGTSRNIRFNTHAAKHHFCARCGIYTHQQRRFDPSLSAVNVACLDGVGPFDFTEVPVLDGRRHPLDQGGGPLQMIGTLRFERIEENIAPI